MEEAKPVKRFATTWVVLLIAIALGGVAWWSQRQARESANTRLAAAGPD